MLHYVVVGLFTVAIYAPFYLLFHDYSTLAVVAAFAVAIIGLFALDTEDNPTRNMAMMFAFAATAYALWFFSFLYLWEHVSREDFDGWGGLIYIGHFLLLPFAVKLREAIIWLAWRRKTLENIRTSTDADWLAEKYLTKSYIAPYLRKAALRRIAEINDATE